MSTPATAIAGGFFAQLMPMLADRTVMMIVSKADEQHLTVSVILQTVERQRERGAGDAVLLHGNPRKNLHCELPTQVREFVAGHVRMLGANLAEIQREREEAEKAAREELKKKQKTVGNGGAKGKAAEPALKQEDKPAPAPPRSPMLSLFDLPAQDEAAPCLTSGQETKEEEEEEEEVSHAGQSDAP